MVCELLAVNAVKRFTYAELAGTMGVTEHVVGRCLRNQRYISHAELALFAGALDFTVSELLGRAERRFEQTRAAADNREAANI